jgi:hypothetical protein
MPITTTEVDCDAGEIWTQAMGSSPAPARQLLEAFQGEIESLLGSTATALLRKAATVLHRALGGVYGDEIDEIAELAGVSAGDVLLANLAYDLSNAGCSTMALSTRRGPLHARNLDWPFPRNLLRKHTTVITFENAPVGSYTIVGWPGLFGVLTGVAQDRFTVTVNYVIHDTESGKLGLLKRAVKGYWPVPWAVRQAFDTCKSFKSAVKFLSDIPLLAPVIFVVTGAKNEERVVIERSCDDVRLGRTRGGNLFVTNHYQGFADANIDLDGMDTEERLEVLTEAAVPSGAKTALALLSRRGIASEITAHQVVMSAATGELHVRVPGGRTTTIKID